MEIAGHSDIRLTLSVYTHVYDEAKQQAADAMDRLFPEEAGYRLSLRRTDHITAVGGD